MTWYEKMSEGMRLMKEACIENDSWNKCWGCPFDPICEKLTIMSKQDGEFDQYIPSNWGEEERK